MRSRALAAPEVDRRALGSMVALAAALLGACRDTPPAGVSTSPPPAPTAPRSTSTSALASAPSSTPPSPSSSVTPASSSLAEATASPRVATDWCIDELPGLDEDVCYVLPSLPAGRPRRLLVYLHGITPPQPASPQKQNVQSAVLHASLKAGAAALVPRGVRGIGPEGARDWWAWPTSPDAHVRLAATILGRVREAKAKLERISGITFDRVYLAGSSNGAYFLSALAVRGELPSLGFPVHGVGAMSGGGSGGASAAALEGRPQVRTYVGFGTYDADTKKHALGLADVLAKAHWPVRVREHPVGHGAREVYLDEAFAFWDADDAAAAP